MYTPHFVSEYLYRLLREKFLPQQGFILDPCVGKGSLLLPWQKNGYSVLGIDLFPQGFSPESFMQKDYLSLKKGEIASPSCILMNPPFNISETNQEEIKKKYGGRPLLPELWLMKSIELFGSHIPMVLFTPYGFRLNQTMESSRWKKFIQGDYPEIDAIISLPKDLFENTLFHSEILLFNIPMEKGHYFITR